MAIVGLFTNSGMRRSIDAANDEGFLIFPEKFSVSRDAGALDPLRSTPNSGVWYEEFISTRVVVDSTTIKVVCQIPPNASPIPEEIREIYLLGKDSNNDDFMLAFGQPTDAIIYDPSGTVTLELQISIVDIDLTAQYVFQNTKQTELDDHLTAPDAHLEYAEAMAKAGIFVPAGSFGFSYVGQTFLEYPYFEFDGTKAFTSYQGVGFSARFNGDELNGEVLTFDGQKDLITVIGEFNDAHPKNQIDHDGNDLQVLGAGSVVLGGGSYNLEEGDLVYKDDDGLVKAAIADGTNAGKVIGVAYLADKLVRGLGGFVSMQTGFNVGDDLFLSDIEAGKITNISTSSRVGVQVDPDFILLNTLGGGSGSISAGYDAIVSNSPGFARYQSLQDAIDAVPNHGFILHEKIEELTSRVRTNGKTVNVVFRGYNTGLTRFEGQNEIQRILFSDVPDGGTWRIEFKELFTGIIQFTNDLPFNASAALIQSEINTLMGHNGVTVTGDYASGFTLEFNDFIDLPLIGTEDTGQNEIQRFEFSDIPTDGTIDFEFEGNSGFNHAFNDTPEQLKAILLSIPGINDIDVRGSFQDKFYEIEFKGVDGLENRSPILALNSNLNVGGSGGVGGTPVSVNGLLAFPVQAATIKDGRFPASNLLIGTQDVEITVIEAQKGIEVGPSKAIELDSDNNQFIGMGRLIGFNTGIDMSGFVGTRIELNFDQVELPLDGQGQILGRNFSFDGSIGIEKDAFDAKPIYETPVGDIDGINASYTIEFEPNTRSQFALLRDQLWLRPEWYEIVGTTLNIINPSAIPVPGQDILAWYTPDVLDFTPDITYEPWFYENFTGLQDEFKIDLGNNYNRGSDRLEMYRNGLYMNLGTAVGSDVNKYQEFSINEIGLSLHTQSDDVFTAVFKDYRILSRGAIQQAPGLSTLVVAPYTLGNNSIRVWRNGLLMNSAGIGSPEQQYTEFDSTTLTLAVPVEPDDIFQYEISEFEGTREEIDGLNDTAIVNLTNIIASGKLFVYRNGLLIHNSVTLGQPIDRYQVLNNSTIELGENAQLDDWITVITVPL
jgi:hypothetical protein